MRYIKQFFIALWRIWFVLINIFLIMVCFPYMLFLLLLKEPFIPLFRLQVFWARYNLILLGLRPVLKTNTQLEPNKTYMIIGNHTSMLDIMLMLHFNSKNPFMFVGKAEIAKVPLLGMYFTINNIMVDRSNPVSRRKVFMDARKAMLQNRSICIFPEGGIPDESVGWLGKFKDGAFSISQKIEVPIVAYVFHNLREQFPYYGFKGYPGKVYCERLDIINSSDKVLSKKQAYDEMKLALDTQFKKKPARSNE